MYLAATQQADGLQWPAASLPILLVLLTISAVILWRRFRSRRQLIERINDLEALSAAGRAIVAAQLDIVTLSRLIAEEAGGIIDTRTFQIGLFEDDVYEILYWTINGEQKEIPASFDLKDNAGLVGWVRENKRLLLIADFAKERDTLPAQPRYVSESPPRSAVFVPLVSGEVGIYPRHTPLIGEIKPGEDS